LIKADAGLGLGLTWSRSAFWIDMIPVVRCYTRLSNAMTLIASARKMSTGFACDVDHIRSVFTLFSPHFHFFCPLLCFHSRCLITIRHFPLLLAFADDDICELRVRRSLPSTLVVIAIVLHYSPPISSCFLGYASGTISHFLGIHSRP
jgi:hypothetical protein